MSLTSVTRVPEKPPSEGEKKTDRENNLCLYDMSQTEEIMIGNIRAMIGVNNTVQKIMPFLLVNGFNEQFIRFSNVRVFGCGGGGIPDYFHFFLF